MNLNKFLVPAIGIIVLIGAGYFFYMQNAEAPVGFPKFPSAEINPATSAYTYTNASGDVILIDTPTANATVGKAFTISGKARGTWYFEASFPVRVTALNGAVLAELPATANGDWMTNDFVPFSVNVTIPNGYSGPATVTLKKDNPSGEPQNDASVSYPITIQ